MENCSQNFNKLFSTPSTIKASAHARVNLIGEHTDYTGGYVMPSLLSFKTDIFLNELYAFDKGIVLFKPTKAKDEQFRFTKEKALSYFIAGKKKICKEDSGFAIHPWKKITFNNSSYIIEDNIAFVMGNYYFTDLNDITLKIEYTFGYKLINDKMKIFLYAAKN